MKLLGNYCRNQKMKTSITVGVVGFPNVGKSSVINSLKRSRACNVGSTPGVTKNMQEIQLDQHVKLLDCPGIVMATGSSDTQIILKNVVKVESLDDPVKPVEAILNRCNKEQIMQKYCVPDYADTVEFLSAFAKRMGRLRKGGVPDTLAAAKVLLQDWNSGKISFYTHPPVETKSSEETAVIAQYWGAGFDIDALEKAEKDDLNGLADSLTSALVLEPGKPTDMETENTEGEEEDGSEEMDSDDEDQDEEDDVEEGEGQMEESDDEVQINNPLLKQSVVALKMKNKSKGNVKESEGKKKEKTSDADDENVQINAQRKKVFKTKQKERRKKIKKILSSEENKMVDDDNDTYDFNQAF